MGYATGLLEFSDSPLSDTSPSYDDRTSYLIGDVSWSDGKSRDLDEPQAGSITFRLKSENGEWTPNSPDSLYPDSPFILRRFRWSVNGTAEGVWCPVAWQTTYPADTSYAVIEVTCVDQVFATLSLDALDLLDPPTASSYEEVVMHDQPFAYYRLIEAGGTQMVPAAGPEGVYKKLTGGVIRFRNAGLINGDPSLHLVVQEAYGRAPLGDTNQFADNNAVTVEAIGLLSAVTDGFIAAGPYSSTASANTFALSYSDSTDRYVFTVALTNGTTPTVSSSTHGISDLTQHHVIGTWDGQTLTITVNGVLEGTTSAPGVLREGSATEFLYVAAGGSPINANAVLNGLGEVAFYERALNSDRRTAHYQAALERGFDPQTVGERIASIATSDLWAETEIQTGEHTVNAVMEHGQSKLEEILAAAKAEMPDSHFYGNGDANPVYKGWNHNDGNGPIATFGPGGIGYQAIEPVYDDEMFNEVTVGHEAAPGEETQHTVTDTDSVSEFRRRAHAETGLILTDHHDAIAVATSILSKFHRPQQRFASLTVNGNDATARTHILARQIGDLIRVKGIGVNDTDVVTTILGRSKTLTAAGHLTCTWTLARGFDAAAGNWQLGIDGFSELNQTAVLA